MSFLEKLKQRERIEVSIPEWGEKVFVRSLTATEISEISKVTKDSKDEMSFMLQLVIRSTVDADGNQLMHEEDLEDLKANGGLVLLLTAPTVKLNHLNSEKVDDAKKN